MAQTHRTVTLNGTLSIEATGTHAGISAPLLDTGQIVWTVLVDETFRTAVRGRTKHTDDAGTNGPVILDTTVGVGTAWGWHAGVLTLLDFFFNDTPEEGIAGVRGSATTNWVMVIDLAVGV